MLHHPNRAAVQSRKALSYISSYVSATNATNFTFNSVDLGAAFPNRTIMIAAVSSSTGTTGATSSITVNGNSTTLTTSAAALASTSFATYQNDTDTTATVVVNHTAAKDSGCGIAVYSVKNLSSGTASSTAFPAGLGGVTSINTGNINVLAGGFVLVCLTKTGTDAVTWTNATGNANQNGLNSRLFSFASSAIYANNSAYVVTASWASALNARIGGAFWR